MKLKEVLSFVLAHKRYTFLSLLVASLVILLSARFTSIVRANFGTWGDTSLIHACLGPRGQVTVISAGSSCQSNETQDTWLKDVNAGTGLTITRDSNGATLSLDNTTNDGWTSSGDTWTYASAQSFTVTGDQTAKYQKGTRLKFTQTTVKYAFVVASTYSSPNTTVTIATNSDYTIANAMISNTYYSYQDNPQGYPYVFNFTPSLTNGSVGNGTMHAYVSDHGDRVTVDLKWVFGSSSSITGNLTFGGLPTPTSGDEIGSGYFYNNVNNDVVIGSALMAAGQLYPKIPSQPFGSTYGTVGASQPFTWGTADEMRLHLEYQF